MDGDERLVEATWWEGLAVGKTGSCSSKSLIKFSADGWAVFLPCSLARGWTMVMVVMVVMATSFKRTYTSTPGLPGPLQPEPLSPQQATADPCLCRRHSNPQRQVWLSLLWRSLLCYLGPGAHKVLFVPPKHLWRVWGLILNAIVPLLLSFWDFPLPSDAGIFFWWDLTFSCRWLFSS